MKNHCAFSDSLAASCSAAGSAVEEATTTRRDEHEGEGQIGIDRDVDVDDIDNRISFPLEELKQFPPRGA